MNSLIILAFVASATAVAEGNQYTLEQVVIQPSQTATDESGISVNTIIGEPLIGISSSSIYTLQAGFLTAADIPTVDGVIFSDSFESGGAKSQRAE